MADHAGKWSAKHREQKIAQSAGLLGNRAVAKIKLFCIPPVSDLSCFRPLYAASSTANLQTSCDKRPRLLLLGTEQFRKQAGTGAWIFQSWWKSLPECVEVSACHSNHISCACARAACTLPISTWWHIHLLPLLVTLSASWVTCNCH